MESKVLVVALAFLAVPTLIGASTSSTTNNTINSLVGTPCLVQVFHTDFMFPPEGGEVVRFPNGQMFFVQNYVSGCENAGAGGTVIKSSSGASVNVPQNSPSNTYANPPRNCIDP